MITPHEEELLVLIEKIKNEVKCCCSWHRYRDITIYCDQLIEKIKEKNEKRHKKERARKTLGHECTGSNRTIGIWEAVYKKGSMPKT